MSPLTHVTPAVPVDPWRFTRIAAFEEILSRDSRIVYRTRGVCMEPMLRQNRDLVIIETTPSRLRPLDVALYRRGSSYVLHRVIRVEEDHYLIRGTTPIRLKRYRTAPSWVF